MNLCRCGTHQQVFPAFVAVLNGLLLMAALRLPATHDEVLHDAPAPAVLRLLRQRAVVWFFTSVFFTVLANTSLYSFFSLYLVHLGYGKTAVGELWAESVLVEIVFFWTQGNGFSRWPPQRWLQVVALATALVDSAAVAAVPGLALTLLVLSQASYAITFAGHHWACIQLVQLYFPDRLRGRGQAQHTTLGYGFSGVLGGVGGGWLIDSLGFVALFWAAAAAGLVAWACARRAAAHIRA